MSLFKEARKFMINQCITELRQAIKHWPNSDRNTNRDKEIQSLQKDLEAIDEEK